MDYKEKYFKYKLKYLNLKSLNAKSSLKIGDGEPSQPEISFEEKRNEHIRSLETKELIFNIIRHTLLLTNNPLLKPEEINLIINLLDAELKKRITSPETKREVKEYLSNILEITKRLKQLPYLTGVTDGQVLSVIRSNKLLNAIQDEGVIRQQPMTLRPRQRQQPPTTPPLEKNPNCQDGACAPQ